LKKETFKDDEPDKISDFSEFDNEASRINFWKDIAPNSKDKTIKKQHYG